MGISHDYHSTGRRRRGGPGGVIRFAGAVAGILLVSFAITAILEHGQAQPEELPTVTANGTAQNILAPLPMQGAADSTTDSAVSGGENAAADGTPAVTLEQFGPARQTAGAYSVKAYDSSVIRQPASGQVDLSYFSDAAFLGDSLTVGFSDYKINLGGALICGYTGVGPDAIVNRSAVKSSVRGEEVALDVLAAAQPKKLYILLGTNTLTTVGAADRFLAYYGQMLDALRQTLGEDCVIYVESIPPVRPEAAAEKPGLASDIIRSVNEQLALLATEKPDLLLLDVMLPGMNGFDLCSRIRAEGRRIPIIFLSAKNDIVDKSIGFKAGGDDYVTKPFNATELLLRVEANIRRHKDTMDFAKCCNREGVTKIGDLEVHFDEYQVFAKGKPVGLTTKEFEIVAFLARHPGKVFTRGQIQEYLWGEGEADTKTNSITVFVRKMREKIEENPSEPKYLLTVQRVGYKMADAL